MRLKAAGSGRESTEIDRQNRAGNREIHSSTIKTGSLDIHYYTGGDGEPLVVLHGGTGGGAREWVGSMTELSRHYRIYVPDLPGFGLSQAIEGDHGIDDFVNFLDDFAASLGLESFYLTGHSIGGSIAMRYTVKFPHRVKKLVIINGIGMGNDTTAWIRLLGSSAICRSLGVAIAALMKAIQRALDAVFAPLKFMNPLPLAAVLLGAGMAVFRQESAVLVPQLAALMIPTLLVWGARDNIVPVSNAYNAARLIPDCKVHVFEGGGHFVYRQRSKEFTRLMTDFLS